MLHCATMLQAIAIAVLDVNVGAIGLVGRLELDTRVANDIALVIAISTVSGAVVAGRNFERDGVGRKHCFTHVNSP
jgi:hypothetical protein